MDSGYIFKEEDNQPELSSEPPPVTCLIILFPFQLFLQNNRESRNQLESVALLREGWRLQGRRVGKDQ